MRFLLGRRRPPALSLLDRPRFDRRFKTAPFVQATRHLMTSEASNLYERASGATKGPMSPSRGEMSPNETQHPHRTHAAIEWLLPSDEPAVRRMTNRHVLSEPLKEDDHLEVLKGLGIPSARRPTT